MVEHGAVVERGTHRELLGLDGRYKQLHDRQHGVEMDQFINPGEDFTASNLEEEGALEGVQNHPRGGG